MSSIPDSLRAYTRTAWRTETVREDGPPSASKYAGTPWISAGDAHPVCANCGRPLQLFLQLNTSDLPEALRGAYGEGLIQLFYCTSVDPHCEIETEAWFPFSASVVARQVVPEGEPEQIQGDTTFPPQRIVGWTPIEDVPNGEEARDPLGVDLSQEEEEGLWDAGLPRAGDKLGGWPAWVQGVEYPTCPRCGTQMQLVFQLDSECHLPFMFGDMGIGHLTQCPQHTDVLAFGWACG